MFRFQTHAGVYSNHTYLLLQFPETGGTWIGISNDGRNYFYGTISKADYDWFKNNVGRTIGMYIRLQYNDASKPEWWIGGGLSYGFIRKYILVMLRASNRGARHDLAQASHDGRRFGAEAQRHHLYEQKHGRRICIERRAHVRSAGWRAENRLFQRSFGTVTGLLGHSRCCAADSRRDRHGCRLLRRSYVERHGRLGNLWVEQLFSENGEFQHVPALGVRDHHFSRSSFRLAANAAFCKEAA